MRSAGAEALLEPFSLNRVEPQACYLRISDRCVEGFPVFDAGFTRAEGVSGRLGITRALAGAISDESRRTALITLFGTKEQAAEKLAAPQSEIRATAAMRF